MTERTVPIRHSNSEPARHVENDLYMSADLWYVIFNLDARTGNLHHVTHMQH